MSPVARAASVATGLAGRVVGSDLNPGMIAMAQSLPATGGGELTWRQASALELPFEDNVFDAVISQQGIQFFPYSSAGLREMARVTKQGGRLGATVWADSEQSPYLHSVFGMLTARCGGDPVANSKVFASGGADEVRDWFTVAELRSVDIELVEATVVLPPVQEYLPDHLKALPPLSLGNYFELDKHAQNLLVQQIENELSAFKTDAGLEVPFRSYIATIRT